jgi:hypothetical protein
VIITVKPLPISARQGRSERTGVTETLVAKRFHPARSAAAPARPPCRTLRGRRRFGLGLEDFGDDGLGCGYEQLALFVAGEIDPFETGLVGLCGPEALRRRKDFDLEADRSVDGNAVLGKQMQVMFGGKYLRGLLG